MFYIGITWNIMEHHGTSWNINIRITLTNSARIWNTVTRDYFLPFFGNLISEVGRSTISKQVMGSSELSMWSQVRQMISIHILSWSNRKTEQLKMKIFPTSGKKNTIVFRFPLALLHGSLAWPWLVVPPIRPFRLEEKYQGSEGDHEEKLRSACDFKKRDASTGTL